MHEILPHTAFRCFSSDRVQIISVPSYRVTARLCFSLTLLMYLYKFEELERQVKLLLAPVKVVTSKLTENEQALRDFHLRNLDAELQAAVKEAVKDSFLLRRISVPVN